jgi:hypothetical protein
MLYLESIKLHYWMSEFTTKTFTLEGTDKSFSHIKLLFISLCDFSAKSYNTWVKQGMLFVLFDFSAFFVAAFGKM